MVEREVSIVVLCAEQDDLTPALVRIVHAIVSEGFEIDVLAIENDDVTSPDLFRSHPDATFIVLWSANVRPQRLDGIRRAFATHATPDQALVIHCLRSRPAHVLAAIADVRAHSGPRRHLDVAARRLVFAHAAAIGAEIAERSSHMPARLSPPCSPPPRPAPRPASPARGVIDMLGILRTRIPITDC